MAKIDRFHIINPAINKKSSYYNTKTQELIVYIKGVYKYYLEVMGHDHHGMVQYYLLFSNDKFDENARLCNKDMYGKYRLKIAGEFKDYIIDKSTDGNIDIKYEDSDDNYDVYIVD